MRFVVKLLLTLTIVLIFFSCKKNITNPPLIGSMSFKLNGQLQQVKTDSTDVSLTTELRALRINGLYNNKQLLIYFENAQVGTYTVGKDITSLAYFPVRFQGPLAYNATSGTVTITSISTTFVSGTFQFTASDSTGNVVNITDGNFSSPIQEYFN